MSGAIQFNRPAIEQAADDAQRRLRMRVGAFVMRRARSSIRSRKTISQPGSPPSGHTNKLREGIFFADDPAARSVVIGPVSRGGSTVPGLIEHGGTVRINGRTRRYRARPFMDPAFRAELQGKLAGQLRTMFQG